MTILSTENIGCELIYAIVGSGQGSKVLHIAKQQGISGGTIFFGKGTVKNTILEMLALDDVRKEIVLMAADSSTGISVLERLNKELKLYKPGHGIAYTVPLSGICGSRCFEIHKKEKSEGVDNTVYQSIIVIVDKGKGEDVVEAASKAGAVGATIINARGSGVHETSKLFAMEIEPEKEIVLMITPESRTEAIVGSISQNFHIDKPGKGIIFVQNVARTYGLADMG